MIQMDYLSSRADKMMEIMNNRSNYHRPLEDEIYDIAEVICHLIIRLQVLEISMKDLRGEKNDR